MCSSDLLKPLLTSTSAVVAIAAGKLDTPLRVTTRTDEIGDMQRAISDLRHTSADKRRLEREREQLIEKLQLHSNTDFLTNLLNRRAFTERVTQQLAIAQRNNWPVALIMFDLDHFKQVNDLHGHAVGDTVLTEVAVIASKLFRAADTLARHGGEEFIACLQPFPRGRLGGRCEQRFAFQHPMDEFRSSRIGWLAIRVGSDRGKRAVQGGLQSAIERGGIIGRGERIRQHRVVHLRQSRIFVRFHDTPHDKLARIARCELDVHAMILVRGQVVTDPSPLSGRAVPFHKHAAMQRSGDDQM